MVIQRKGQGAYVSSNTNTVMDPHVMDPHLPINTPQGKPEGDVKDTQSFSKGSKRLFSHTFSRYSQEEDSASNYASGSDGRHLDEDDPFEKRHRTSDWPLGGNGKTIEGAAADGPDSPTSNYSDDGIQTRSSKFIEGSMRNRVSQKPPRKYVATETELNCAGENECTKNGKPQRNKLIRHSNHSVPAVAGETKTEANRHSTIFRFGKSLAASFNPSNWKIWSKSQDARVPDDKADVEAQAKLERAYREVKSIAPTPGRRFGPAGGSAIWSNPRSSVNASGVEISEQAPSQKRYGMVFDTPPSMAGLGGDFGSAQQGTSKLSTPADRYSVPSHQLLHSNESRSSFTYGSIAPPKSMKHKLSRKDLRVQQKLVKRVSNLESKLEAARLELVKSLGNTGIPPQQARGGKSRFLPGALSSLPSESLLNGYTHQNESSQSYIGAALTTDDKISLSASRNHDDPPGRPSTSSFSSSVREYPNGESHYTTTGPDDADQVTPSKKRKNMAKTSTSTTSSSQHPSDADTSTTSHPAKKSRNNNTPREKPSPELLIPDSSSSSDPSFENVDPEKKAVLVSVGAKQQGTPKLIVKKRLPLGTQGSRIPRKGSRKDTPPASEVGGEKGISVTSGNAGVQEASAVESQPRQGVGKLKKAAKPRVKSTELTQVEKQVEEKTKDTKESIPAAGGGEVTNSTSMESFEWGPDVF
ncbi:hypothetical protein VC83_00892 [Pseudogymnoascus destructans]|uniref:Nuclear RNA binding protein n=2 Tax=Pseudogymnoascus destructans TaxID=655981 RepID=L8FMH1_PSED2|nr:uncharacterized protein VC83_00892 [Pseudogymnoascus destructans]ELR01668.1 hypothetical protein GMDG_00044 [Pseudogymnoascus destructans 20631-21]OAF62806.1 hypothetical protein VC83_00892 [Pseudogymnoascus destructans]